MRRSLGLPMGQAPDGVRYAVLSLVDGFVPAEPEADALPRKDVAGQEFMAFADWTGCSTSGTSALP
nr:hypothetical protein SHINE37_43566 [Rhizobiaceae bacterium]